MRLLRDHAGGRRLFTCADSPRWDLSVDEAALALSHPSQAQGLPFVDQEPCDLCEWHTCFVSGAG